MTDTSTSVLRFAEEIHVTDFNCVVCMEPMIGKKVFQCCKGEHNLCELCMKCIQPPKCPLDREYGSFIPDPRRERLIAKTVTKCPHPLCKTKTFPWLMADHIASCKFKKMTCPLCTQTLTQVGDITNVFRSHFQSGECNKKWQWRKCMSFSNVPFYKRTKRVIFQVNHYLLFIECIRTFQDTKICNLSVISLEDDDALKHYFFWIRIGPFTDIHIPIRPWYVMVPDEEVSKIGKVRTVMNAPSTLQFFL